MQGPGAARPWVEAAGVTFRSLVDESDTLSARFGLSMVPVTLFVGSDRRLAAPPTGVNPFEDDQRARIRAWARGEQPTPGFETDARRQGDGTFEQVEARAWLRLARLALSDSRRDDAIAHLRRGFELDPDNWLIRKQWWAVEHPDRFYRDGIDVEWQQRLIAEGR